MIINGDCLEEMRKMADNSIDFICTDPPYGLSFMGKTWDDKTPGIDYWKEALRICKPGSTIAVFGASRTHHHMMMSLENAGFEIRDCIMWLYGSGFPKSHNFGRKIGGEWSKFGTALKPAYEPIILAMKPLDGTFAQNAEKWGVAGINIDDSRIPTDNYLGRPKGEQVNCYGKFERMISESNPKGRWPANIILDEWAAEQLDKMSGVLKSGLISKHHKINKNRSTIYEDGLKEIEGLQSFGDSGGASRFFYCAKASSKERNAGLEGMPLKDSSGCYGEFEGDGRGRQTEHSPKQNFHPTVKPIALMKYLLKLLCPPGKPTCLDPFAGSGSTLVAAKELGIKFIGIEKEAEYCEIANKRIEHAKFIPEQLEMAL